MSHSTNHILTTHVGSLIRPPDLLALIEARQDSRPVDDAVFIETLRHSVAEIVRQQAEAGIDIVSDGEFGKIGSWSRYVVERLSGIEFRPGAVASISSIRGKDFRDFEEFYTEYETEHGAAGLGKSIAPAGGWAITGPITYTGQAQIGRDIANLKTALDGNNVTAGFLPVVAPASVLPSRTDEFYKTEEEALFAIADAMHEEYTAVVEAGLMVQIDDAFLASYYDVMVPPATLQEYRKWAALRVDALNHALRGIPAERCRYHVCWGSWNGPHTNDVPLKDIADLILRVNVAGYSLEMANPRHEHEWRVWETVKLPEGKTLLPGVISHATNVVEHPELVAERLIRLARLVGPENVIASTDCGFAQGPFGRRVHPSIMWAKLRALSEGAAIANRTLAASVSAAGAAAQPASFGDERVRDDAPMEDEEKILAGRTDANIPALLTKDVRGG
jgi:5-methyltetrahydropteroyltriglutamate--homocysteine methyltransferase